jgi:deazaflavin-dependent oxidoreductase (nitroreductase family)
MDIVAAVSARITNLVARRFPEAGKKSAERHVETFRKSGGRKGNSIFGRPVFLLEVVGRKSGQSSIMLMHAPRGDDLIVIGSGGGSPSTPNWYRNLMAAGGGTVQVGAERCAVTARELEDGPERDECWRLAAKVYPGFDAYQTFVDRTIPLALLERV